MPKVTNEYYQYGYVRAKVSEIQAITDRLSETIRIFTTNQLDDIQNDLERIHSEVQCNIQAIAPADVNDLLRTYEAVSITADRELLHRRQDLEQQLRAERELLRRQQDFEQQRHESQTKSHAVRRFELERPQASVSAPHAGAIPKRKVILVPETEGPVSIAPTPSRSAAFADQLNRHIALEKKEKKKKEKTVSDVFQESSAFDDPRGPYAEYASDNEDPLPPALCSAARPAAGFKPIKFPSTDLRNRLQTRQKILDQRVLSVQTPSAYRNVQEIESPKYTPHNRDQGSVSHSGSISSVQSYQSSKQEVMRGIVTGIKYPPRGTRLPDGVRLNKNDPNIIGMAEFYVQTINPKCCVLCRGPHRLFNCNTFIREGLQRRWYIVLTKGVCLFCLYPGHSSFTCHTEGTCDICGIRHNSRLCPGRACNL